MVHAIRAAVNRADSAIHPEKQQCRFEGQRASPTLHPSFSNR